MLNIQKYLFEQGFTSSLEEIDGVQRLVVESQLSERNVQLALLSEGPYLSLPSFFLLEPLQYGKLAHVTVLNHKGRSYGQICVNPSDSISVNFEQPHLAIKASLERHLNLLQSVLNEPSWNKTELIREFYSNWQLICDFRHKPLLINFDEPKLQKVNVYGAVPHVGFGLASYYIALSNDKNISEVSAPQLEAQRKGRRLAGQAIVIPIDNLKPAPNTDESLEQWYINTVNDLSIPNRTKLQATYGQWRDKVFWLIFTAKTIDDERTWFTLKLSHKKKKTLPVKSEQLDDWSLTPINTITFNQHNVVRRGGGKNSLAEKKVAIVGIGSVGGEIAHKLSAAGVSNLTLIDNDIYEINNLYRHVLPTDYIGFPKAQATAFYCHNQFPWSNARYLNMDLLTFAKESKLESFDLLILAIGSPTHERFFKQHLVNNDIKTNTINCWVEGFGIGGHAILDINESNGCLLCAYTCLNDGARGLSSNINFIENNQSITKSIAGCGDLFISYSAVSSAQTAIMTSSLAIQYLEGKQLESCKVSWKGDDSDAKAEGVSLTHRYYQFNSPLKHLPLLSDECDVCNN